MKYRIGSMLLFFIMLATSPLGISYATAEERIDNIPMYGQPTIARPDSLIKADNDFISQAAAGFGGDRHAASKAWSAEGDRFMREGNLDFAMRRYNQSWLLNPDSYLPYWGFGRVLLERDKVASSVEQFEKALALCDDNYQKVGLLSDAGTAYSFLAFDTPGSMPEEKSRIFGLANQKFEEGTNLAPKYPNIWLRWSYSLFREGSFAAAWQKLQTAQSLGLKASPAYIEQLKQKIPEPSQANSISPD